MVSPPVTAGDAVERARDVARRIAAPDAPMTDKGIWPQRALQELQAIGLGGLTAPRTAGGSGMGLRVLAEVCAVLGQACASTALCFGMHAVATAVLAAKATPQQAEEFLVPIAAGEHLTTLALSEPGTGAHFWLPQTRLETRAGGYRVQGEKSFVTNGSHADSYVVSAVAGFDASPGDFSCVVIPGAAPGMVWMDQWTGIGMRGNSSRSVQLNAIELPDHYLLGAPGDQIWYVFEVIAPFFLMAMSGTYLGIAQASLDEATSHLERRHHAHTGRSLASEPILQHRLGTLWAQVERTRRLVFWAAEEGQRGGPQSLAALASAKAEVADCAVSVTNEAMTLLGGIGYREHGRLQRCLRDARAAPVMSPTTDILRVWVGRALLGIPLLGD